MRNNCSKKLFTLVKNNLIDKYIYIFSLKIKKVSLQRVNQFVKVLAYISSNIKFPKINRPRNRYIDTSRGIEVNSVRSNPLEQNGGISELSIIGRIRVKIGYGLSRVKNILHNSINPTRIRDAPFHN